MSQPIPLGPSGSAILDLAQRIADAQNVFVLTGSGISAGSGLPTYRGYASTSRSAESLRFAKRGGFEEDPLGAWRWWNSRRYLHTMLEPNAAHHALAELERLVPLTLATQNVDSLHQRAGSRAVHELHGSLRYARCTGCAERRELDAQGLPLDEIDHNCGGRWGPGFVRFGDPVPAEALEPARIAASTADVILSVGTSVVVEPAASLVRRWPRPDAVVAEINLELTPLSTRAGFVLRANAAEVLPPLVAAVAALRWRAPQEP